jgi:hypothetical protein
MTKENAKHMNSQAGLLWLANFLKFRVLQQLITVQRHRLLVSSVFSGQEAACDNSGMMGSSDECIGRQILVKEGQHLGRSRSVAPVTHQVRSDSEGRKNVNASSAHTVVRLGRGLGVEGPASVRVDENGVTCLKKRKGDKDNTNIGGDTGDENLLLSSGLDSISKVGVVPSIDLAVAFDKGRIGVHFQNLLRERTVGTGLSTGGHDCGKVENLAHGGVGKDVGPELVRLDVASNEEEADLVVDDEQSAIVLVETFEFVSGHVE